MWGVRCGVSVALEGLVERGIEVDHVTIYQWVQRSVDGEHLCLRVQVIRIREVHDARAGLIAPVDEDVAPLRSGTTLRLWSVQFSVADCGRGSTHVPSRAPFAELKK